eukprot:TRINITY_DN255_c0_g1_i1.p1 TRINITY_DN255_c0_g1~~TRINITY_DN255_c0_g1_i1.p1  ORF type:complete len:480 (-),score=48.61 TRINITY_DN255_c0_g1_i1:95-1387(-)
MWKKTFVLILTVLMLRAEETSHIFPDETYIADSIPIDSEFTFFFWLFKSRDKNPTAPLVLWLQGGPGTSGVEVALYENGPYRISKDLLAKRVAHSLNNNTDVLYIDQPIGTGFSNCDRKTRYPIDETQVATDLYNFFLGFFQKYPEYKGRPLYITGQSFGGHFIPGALPIILKKDNPDINVKGIAIGNAHINPNVQFPQYAEYAYGKKLITYSEYESLKKTFALCKRYLDLGLAYITFIETYCTGGYLSIVGSPPYMRFNPYDVREPCKKQPACYDFDDLKAFMKKPEVKAELGVSDKSWDVNNIDIIMALRLDYWRDYSAGVTYFLENNIPVILYYGKEDFICNYFGGLKTIESLKWEGAQRLLREPYKKWMVDNKEMGEYKHYDKLTYLEIYDAGHMATMDNPRIGLDIVNQLIKGINQPQRAIHLLF